MLDCFLIVKYYWKGEYYMNGDELILDEGETYQLCETMRRYVDSIFDPRETYVIDRYEVRTRVFIGGSSGFWIDPEKNHLNSVEMKLVEIFFKRNIRVFNSTNAGPSVWRVNSYHVRKMNLKENFNIFDFARDVLTPISGDPTMSKLESIWSAFDYLRRISE